VNVADAAHCLKVGHEFPVWLDEVSTDAVVEGEVSRFRASGNSSVVSAEAEIGIAAQKLPAPDVIKLPADGGKIGHKRVVQRPLREFTADEEVEDERNIVREPCGLERTFESVFVVVVVIEIVFEALCDPGNDRRGVSVFAERGMSERDEQKSNEYWSSSH